MKKSCTASHKMEADRIQWGFLVEKGLKAFCSDLVTVRRVIDADVSDSLFPPERHNGRVNTKRANAARLE